MSESTSTGASIPGFPAVLLSVEFRVDPELGRVMWFNYQLADTDQLLTGVVRQDLQTIALEGRPNVCVWTVSSKEQIDRQRIAEDEVLATLRNYWLEKES